MGQILDRSVTLCARHARVLVPIVGIAVIPVALDGYVVDPNDATAGFSAEIASAANYATRLGTGVGHGDVAGPTPLISPSIVGLFVFGLVLSTIGTVACGIAVGRAYDGREVSIGTAYRDALLRWRALLAAGGTAVGLLGAALAGAIILMAVVVVPLASILLAAHVDATLFKVPLLIGGTLAGVLIGAPALALGSFVFQMLLVSIALDDVRPMRGIALGLARTLRPRMLRRSCRAALIAAAVAVAGEQILNLAGDAIVAVTGVPALSFVAQTAGEVVYDMLVIAFVVVYAIDVRVRYEGLDLALAARGLRDAPLGEFSESHPNAPST